MDNGFSFTTSVRELDNLIAFCSQLDFNERKALITLARSQSIPDPHSSPILFSKVSSVLNRMTTDPPFLVLTSENITEEAWSVIRLISSPLTTGIVIVFALGVSLTDEQVEYGKRTSFNKELVATQTARRESMWNWEAILTADTKSVIHPLFPHLSRLQKTFANALPSFRNRTSGRIFLPHYSRRGVSFESAQWLAKRVDKRRVKWGSARTFHRSLDLRNVTSLDIVHHYIRNGEWVTGRTEMKQRWYPSQLLPRTYFCWSGFDIAVSSYLRNFFNDLGDIFSITHRKNRVQPDWLYTDDPSHEGFLFYDLTSFTSWFHEQVPFLRAIANRFRGCIVYLVGENLSLSEHCVGSLIDAYTDRTSDYSEFVVNNSNHQWDNVYVHQCAGFLGIPGNLITCTIAHGLSLATFYTDEHRLQVPGDDVGASFSSTSMRRDIMTCASTLGTLQFDKVFHQPQLCLYLKRLVVNSPKSVSLSPMLIYPLLPYLIKPTDGYRLRSNQYRLPDADKLHSRAAHVLVSFHRDVWKNTGGNIDSITEEIILLFVRRIHDQIGLPYGAIFQGRVYGSDGEADMTYNSIPVKFSVESDTCFRVNPDMHFASRYVTRMTIRAVTDVKVDEGYTSLRSGSKIVVRISKGWKFLADMGYISLGGIPGEKIELIGSDARDAYLFASEPPYREVEVFEDLDTQQLIAAGVIRSPEVGSFEEVQNRYVDVNMQSWRYRRYVDLDDPKSAGFFGRSREWVDDGLASTRASLSPEPDMILDY